MFGYIKKWLIYLSINFSHYFHVRLPIFDSARQLKPDSILRIPDGRELSLVGYVRETIARHKSYDVRETQYLQVSTSKKDKIARFVTYMRRVIRYPMHTVDYGIFARECREHIFARRILLDFRWRDNAFLKFRVCSNR